MKKNILIISIIVATFIIPFATSFLLEIPIIEISLMRKILIWLLFIFEILFGITAVRILLNTKQ